MLSSSKAIIVTCFLGIVLSVLLSGLYFRFSYFEPDTVSYSFQAKLFARGKLCLEAPPDYGFSPSPHINILNGKWYSKYAFGNALMLTLGEFVNAHWLVPALVTGFALFLLYLLVREAYGSRIALLASILGLISPATLGMGCTWFSEPVSRFYLAIYLLTLIRALKGGHWFYSVLSGFTLGYAFNTRPMSATAFGLAGAFLTIYWIASSQKKSSILRVIGILLIPFTLMMGLCMAWNFYFTGHPLEFTHNAAQPYDKIGFGKRTEGYNPDLERTPVFTPKMALKRILTHTIPCISFNTLGWGYYRPGLLRSIVLREPCYRWLTLRIIPSIFPIILMLIPIFHPSRNRYDMLFLGLLLFNLLLYLPFYFEASTWGITPAHARYYNECTLLGIIPLVARGMSITYGWMCNMRSRLAAGTSYIIFLSIALLTANTVYTYVLVGNTYRNWIPEYQRLPHLVEQQDIHHAVIFVPGIYAPIGDYPFQSLQDADIIYFRLGSFKAWRLSNSDWRSVYEQYFKGKNAYIYKNEQLVHLIAGSQAYGLISP